MGLIVCASFVSNPMPWVRPLAPLLGGLPIGPALRFFGPRKLFGGYQTHALRELFDATADRVSTTVLLARIRDALEIDVSTLLASVDVPTMYIQATKDTLLPEAAAERFSCLAPKANVVKIDAPHGVLQCEPELAARTILEFVRSVSQAP